MRLDLVQIVRPLRLAVTIAALWTAASAATAADMPLTDGAGCGPVRAVTDLGGLLDYRLRNIDGRVISGLAQVDRFHTEPAQRALAANLRDHSVMADLDFTLKYSPNHQVALRMLVAYERAGGQIYEYSEFPCYFFWARQFASGDAPVLQLEALREWKTGRSERAEELYKQALAIEPDSAELNYHAGLFYFSKKNYAAAREHARTAYAAGYPLPGLRLMLQRAGQWGDPAVPATKP